mgnify:CR=1 FL=1
MLVMALLLFACEGDDGQRIEEEIMEIPDGFPEMEFPNDNEYTMARWRLGKKLFYEPLLSLDSSISCGSCHEQQSAFAVNTATSAGVMDRPGTRNSPTLANVGYAPYYTREGGVSTLEMQVLVPIQEHNEFGFNILKIENRLKHDSSYQQMSRTAYQRPFDYFVLTRAIATFERSLISGHSAYDAFFYSGNSNALTKEEKRGMDLFFSERLACSECHGGFNFTDYSFHNNGLYEDYPDPGRFRLTAQSGDVGKFKVATLRNIARTAPYMHDGSLKTLLDVIEHYNSGGENHKNKNSLIRPLYLSNTEKQELVAFLETLTDEKFLNNSNFNK